VYILDVEIKEVEPGIELSHKSTTSEQGRIAECGVVIQSTTEA